MKKIILAITLCAALSACAPQVQLGQQGKQYGMQWLAQNPWYDPSSNDPDSRAVVRLDQQLYSEGYNPETQAYWDELTRRAKIALPQRFKSAAEEKAELEATKDQWCKREGFKPKTAQYKRCRADLEKEIARRQKEYAEQWKKEQAEIESRQREAALAQARAAAQQQDLQQKCGSIDVSGRIAAAQRLIESGDGGMKALGQMYLNQAYADQRNAALCRNDSQSYFQSQQLEMQQQQLELQRQQLEQQQMQQYRNLHQDVNCRPDVIGGFQCSRF